MNDIGFAKQYYKDSVRHQHIISPFGRYINHGKPAYGNKYLFDASLKYDGSSFRLINGMFQYGQSGWDGIFTGEVHGKCANHRQFKLRASHGVTSSKLSPYQAMWKYQHDIDRMLGLFPPR
ncbi:MAG: hypothetical protein ACLU4J_24060 [Butyricimonas paravirosa]